MFDLDISGLAIGDGENLVGADVDGDMLLLKKNR